MPACEYVCGCLERSFHFFLSSSLCVHFYVLSIRLVYFRCVFILKKERII